MSQNRGTLYRVHVASDGVVWYAADQHMPIPTGMTADIFADNQPMQKDDEVVMVGARSNAKLLLRLDKLKQQKLFSSLKVCSPMSCKSDKRRQDPKAVIMDVMQLKDYVGSLGGWHEFREPDRLAYELAAQTDAAEVIKVLYRHPAWEAMSFPKGLHDIRLAQLIGGLIDPRWYVDIESPETSTRMQGYLGLNPRTQHTVSLESQAKAFALDRCRLVKEVWKSIDEPSAAEIESNPRLFLWRIYKAEGEGYMADLRVSQVLVTFLRETWLDAIYKDNGGASKEGLFAPDHFFKTSEEVEAFKLFMCKTTHDQQNE